MSAIEIDGLTKRFGPVRAQTHGQPVVTSTWAEAEPSRRRATAGVQPGYRIRPGAQTPCGHRTVELGIGLNNSNCSPAAVLNDPSGRAVA